jgi:hypothetical protein
MPSPDEKLECNCGWLARLAADPREAVEFDARLNEHHIQRKDGSGYSLIYFCPLCGGRAPKSQRSRLFHSLTEAERHRLTELTKDLRTVQQVRAALGEPDIEGLRLTVARPETEGKPETTQSYPAMTYSKLSETAIINVQVYPDDKVGITFQGKPMLARQTHEIHMAPSAKPAAQVDTGKRYDVYCIEPNRQSVVYRNARFKGAVALLPHPGGRMHYADFLELEQTNGQSIFIPRSSIVRFCEPGTAMIGEAINPDKPDAR